MGSIAKRFACNELELSCVKSKLLRATWSALVSRVGVSSRWRAIQRRQVYSVAVAIVA